MSPIPPHSSAGQGAEPEDEAQDDGDAVWVGQWSLLLSNRPRPLPSSVTVRMSRGQLSVNQYPYACPTIVAISHPNTSEKSNVVIQPRLSCLRNSTKVTMIALSATAPNEMGLWWYKP